MRIRTSIAVAFALTLAACGSSEESTETAAATDAELATPNPVVAVQQFVDTMAASDLFETEAGKLAQEKGVSQAVKDFGAMMVKDHETSTAGLKAAAAEGNPELVVTPKLMGDQQRKLDQLKAASGSRFDELYSLQQTGAHETALATLKDYAANGSDAGLREFAGKTATAVEAHLEAAKKLP